MRQVLVGPLWDDDDGLLVYDVELPSRELHPSPHISTRGVTSVLFRALGTVLHKIFHPFT
jgi:hypothetical protein